MPDVQICEGKQMLCFSFTYLWVFQPFKHHWGMFTTLFSFQFGLDVSFYFCSFFSRVE